MTQSAKRYGIEVEGNLELEQRLRRIENVLARVTPLLPEIDEEFARGGGTPPQVTGLALAGTIPGGFSVRWNSVNVSDLRRYEVQFALDLAFSSGLQQFDTAVPNYSFTTAEGQTYFCRVRAVNASGVKGAFSVTLNTATGQVATEDLQDSSVTDPKINSTDVASGQVFGFLSGLIISNNSVDSDHDLDISIGSARSSDDSVTIPLGTALTKRIDAVWASGTGNGGLPSAVSLSSNTWYHVFIIANDGATTVDVGFDTDLSATNLLSDSSLTKYRRIGSILTDASSNISEFRQIGDYFYWGVPTQDYSDTSLSTSRISVAIKTPVDIKTIAMVALRTVGAGGLNIAIILTDPDLSDVTPTSAVSQGHADNSGSVDARGKSFIQVPTNTSSEIGFRANTSSASGAAQISTFGWIDQRGRDDGI